MSDSPNKQDHRVRGAQTKKRRTRAQILDAVLASFPGDDPSVPTVVDDVLRKAKVSRATFYKYFASLDEVVGEVGAQINQDLAISRSSIYAGVTDPKVRVATGFQLFLYRASLDHDWGAFIFHSHRLNRDEELVAQIKADLADAVAARLFSIDNMECAVDMLLGTKAEAIRRLKGMVSPRPYIEGITSMVLRGLGLTPDDAREAARMASHRLHEEAPSKLSWWKVASC